MASGWAAARMVTISASRISRREWGQVRQRYRVNRKRLKNPWSRLPKFLESEKRDKNPEILRDVTRYWVFFLFPAGVPATRR
jgi:hypothetical protein